MGASASKSKNKPTEPQSRGYVSVDGFGRRPVPALILFNLSEEEDAEVQGITDSKCVQFVNRQKARNVGHSKTFRMNMRGRNVIPPHLLLNEKGEHAQSAIACDLHLMVNWPRPFELGKSHLTGKSPTKTYGIDCPAVRPMKHFKWKYGKAVLPHYEEKTADKENSETNTSHVDCVRVEPPDQIKGQIARMIAFCFIKYSDSVPFEYSDIIDPNLLLEWHNNFPVSDEERTENNRIALEQLDSNPFVEFPEWLQEHFSQTNLVTNLPSRQPEEKKTKHKPKFRSRSAGGIQNDGSDSDLPAVELLAAADPQIKPAFRNFTVRSGTSRIIIRRQTISEGCYPTWIQTNCKTLGSPKQLGKSFVSQLSEESKEATSS